MIRDDGLPRLTAEEERLRREAMEMADRYSEHLRQSRLLLESREAEVMRLSRTHEEMLRHLSPMREWQERMAAFREMASPMASMLGQMPSALALVEQHGIGRHLSDIQRSMRGIDVSAFAAASAVTQGLNVSELARLSPNWETAERAASIASSFQLPPSLRDFGESQAKLAERLALAGASLSSMRDQWSEQSFGVAFSRTSAFANMMRVNGVVSPETLAVGRELSRFGLPDLPSFASTRAFLDAAGLHLPLIRSPDFAGYDFFRTRLRRPDIEVRRQKFGKLKKAASPKPHQLVAFHHVGRTEKLLRRFIDAAMTEIYGEDWAQERLPLCGCRELLKRSERRGGTPLENADWSHYIDIMVYGPHFEDVFSLGFSDPVTLRNAIDVAAPFRHGLMHFRSFTKQNLLDLRIALAILEDGLFEMMGVFDIEDSELIE